MFGAMRLGAITVGVMLAAIGFVMVSALVRYSATPLIQTAATPPNVMPRLLFIGDLDKDFKALFTAMHAIFTTALQFTDSDKKQARALNATFLRRMTKLKQKLEVMQDQCGEPWQHSFIKMFKLRRQILECINLLCSTGKIPHMDMRIKRMRATVYYFFHVHVYTHAPPTFGSSSSSDSSS